MSSSLKKLPNNFYYHLGLAVATALGGIAIFDDIIILLSRAINTNLLLVARLGAESAVATRHCSTLACIVSHIALVSHAYLQGARAPLPKFWILVARMADIA
eukprot:3859432-Pleurochrysis_carterae.AAC.6